MPTQNKVAALKAAYPQYNHMSESEFADRIYRKHYADKMARSQCGARVRLAEEAPIRIALPDGDAVEFPAGTSQEVMEAALRRYQAEQLAKSGGVGPWAVRQDRQPEAYFGNEEPRYT